MVAQMLEALRADPRFTVHHVNACYSTSTEDIGRARLGKAWRALRYTARALWFRARHGADCLYYIPAPPDSRPTLYRDWLVLLLCRAWFRRVIFHWHAAGLGGWLAGRARPWERRVTGWLLGRPHASIVLGESSRDDARALDSRTVFVIGNGIPDPCPDGDVAAAVRARVQTDGGGMLVRRVLYLSVCSREKGLFDAMDAVALLNAQLACEAAGWRAQLNIAGRFWREPERHEFEERLRTSVGAAALPGGVPMFNYLGFVEGADKVRLFRESDCLCFPTYYTAESFPLVLLEALAFGLPIVTTDWRNIPELLPADYAGLVPPRDSAAIAAALRRMLAVGRDPLLRRRFLDRFSREKFVTRLADALLAAAK